MKTPLGAKRGAAPDPKPGMRINQRLAKEGYATRRGADELIEKGLVFVNGKKAALGDRVLEGDRVEVKGAAARAKYAYFAFHKPAGMDTHDEGPATKNVLASLPPELRALKLFPVGRLDKESHGLLILTNDGRITDRLLNPEHEHEKAYEVTTARPLRASFKDAMGGGVNIEGYETRPAKVEILGERKFRITLTEGKKHQIRRMVAALHNEVEDLKRTRVMNVMLGGLPSGKARAIEGAERDAFLESLGL
jgi:23S rRNA pseudouridine2604 synthase